MSNNEEEKRNEEALKMAYLELHKARLSMHKANQRVARAIEMLENLPNTEDIKTNTQEPKAARGKGKK